jgi:hypothetical protein
MRDTSFWRDPILAHYDCGLVLLTDYFLGFTSLEKLGKACLLPHTP